MAEADADAKLLTVRWDVFERKFSIKIRYLSYFLHNNESQKNLSKYWKTKFGIAKVDIIRTSFFLSGLTFQRLYTVLPHLLQYLEAQISFFLYQLQRHACTKPILSPLSAR